MEEETEEAVEEAKEEEIAEEVPEEEEKVEDLTGSDSALEIVLALLDGDTFHGNLIFGLCHHAKGLGIDSVNKTEVRSLNEFSFEVP